MFPLLKLSVYILYIGLFLINLTLTEPRMQSNSGRREYKDAINSKKITTQKNSVFLLTVVACLLQRV
jgi:hypothetical protein